MIERVEALDPAYALLTIIDKMMAIAQRSAMLAAAAGQDLKAATLAMGMANLTTFAVAVAINAHNELVGIVQARAVGGKDAETRLEGLIRKTITPNLGETKN